MSKSKKYRFSFTSASLMSKEMHMYIFQMIDKGFSLSELSSNDLKKEKSRTRIRKFQEIRLRLAALSKDEMILFTEVDSETQKHICYLAFCRVYDFFKDFIIEVLVDKISLFDYQITDMDYNAFVTRKSVDHEELDNLADTTKAKIKQLTFKVLEQSGIIDNVSYKNIQIPIIDIRLENLLKSTRKSDLRLLLVH